MAQMNDIEMLLKEFWWMAKVDVWFDGISCGADKLDFCDASLSLRSYRTVGSMWFTDSTPTKDVYEHFFARSFGAAVIEENVLRGGRLAKALFDSYGAVSCVVRNWHLGSNFYPGCGSISFFPVVDRPTSESFATFIFYEDGLVCAIVLNVYV